jgi:ElaB/YqjD/DUF883 family membrane-anchored ribosome-binding protein
MNAPAGKLAGDVRVLASDIEELMKATAAQSGERLAAVRARVESALAEAKDTVVLRSRDAARATDRYVHENAWKAVGLGAGIALLVGILIGRR